MRSIIICYYIIRSYDIEINRLVILFRILANSHFCNEIIEKNREKTKKLLLLLQDVVYIQLQLDAILKSIIKRQIPFLIGGTITGTIMAYYYGFLFYYSKQYNVVCDFLFSQQILYKSKGINDQKYLIQYGLSKIKSRNRHYR